MHRNDIVCPTELTYNFPQAGVLSEPTFFRKMLREINCVRAFCPFRRPSCVRTVSTSHAFDLHHAAHFTDDVHACESAMREPAGTKSAESTTPDAAVGLNSCACTCRSIICNSVSCTTLTAKHTNCAVSFTAAVCGPLHTSLTPCASFSLSRIIWGFELADRPSTCTFHEYRAVFILAQVMSAGLQHTVSSLAIVPHVISLVDRPKLETPLFLLLLLLLLPLTWTAVQGVVKIVHHYMY